MSSASFLSLFVWLVILCEAWQERMKLVGEALDGFKHHTGAPMLFCAKGLRVRCMQPSFRLFADTALVK